MNKDILSKVKGEKIVTSHQVARSPDQKVSSRQSPGHQQKQILETGDWKLVTFFILFFFFAFTGDWKLETGDLAFADSITIRTIVTPIGSQSEKWGAKGLMVCIGGEAIPNGGCGPGVTDGFVARKGGSLGDVDEVTNLIEVNDVVIFEDTADGSSSNPNHQYDYDSFNAGGSDVVYEVRGGGVAGVCYTAYCSDDSDWIESPMCPAAVEIGEQGLCDTGFTVQKKLGLWGRCGYGLDSHFRSWFLPPGGGCRSDGGYSRSIIGQAFVCCSD